MEILPFKKKKNKISFVPKIFPKMSRKAVVVGGGNWRLQMASPWLPAIGKIKRPQTMMAAIGSNAVTMVAGN